MNSQKKIAVIGAGIAGLTAAYMLDKNGFEVVIFEADEEIRGIGAGMGLASNAIKAFEYLDLDKKVISIANHLSDFEISDSKGKIILAADTERIKQNYNTDNFAVHRADLHKLLLAHISPDKIRRNKELIQLNVTNQGIHIEFEDDSQETFDFLIGADGVNSKVRQLLIPESSPRYAGYWCWRGVVEVTDKNIHKSVETWGKNGRFGFTPLTHNRIYWYACINTNLDDEVKHFGIEELRERFKNYHAFIPELLSWTDEKELIRNPIMDLKPIPKYHFEKILLIGDAAHATTPNMGQGACMAIEDVAVLQDELQNSDWQTAFENFEKRRLKRTHYITKTSWNAGKIAQLENPFLIFIRNNFLRILPGSISQSQLKDLLDEDFMKF